MRQSLACLIIVLALSTDNSAHGFPIGSSLQHPHHVNSASLRNKDLSPAGSHHHHHKHHKHHHKHKRHHPRQDSLDATPLPPLPLTSPDTPDVEQVLAVLEDSDADENDGNSEYFPYEENLLTPQQAKARMILVFMSISGTIDAIFQHFLQRLPNMMTGNTVRMLDSLANRSWSEFAVGLAMLSSYVLGGISYRCIEIGSRYPEQERNVSLTLKRVAKASLFFLILSDLTATYGHRVWRVSPRWRLPWMSLAFGMVNAAANEAFGVVTSAMTGHWTKVGLGMSEILMLGGEGVMIQTSVKGLSAFVVCALSTFTFIRWLEDFHPRMVASFLPLMGLSIGLVYTMCFYWYANFYKKHVTVHEL